MDVITKIMSLLDARGTTAYQLGKETGISTGLISQWKQRRQHPSARNLQKIADYFDVPVDYFLTNELDDFVKPAGMLGLDMVYSLACDDKDGKVFTLQQKDCIAKLIRLNKRGQDKVLAYIDDLYGNPEYRADKNNS